MTRLRRWFQQWRESWADAAYDETREELAYLQRAQLAQTQALMRLEARIVILEAAGRRKSA